MTSRRAYDVAIIGAGLHGCCAALHFARLGQSVIVLEQGVVGRHASAVNAGGVRQLMREVEEIPLSRLAMRRWFDLEVLLGEELAEMCEFHGHVGQIGVAADEHELNWCEQRARELNDMGYDFEEVIDQAELRRLVPCLSEHCLGGIISREDGHASPAKSTLAFKYRAEQLGAIVLEHAALLGLDLHGETWRIESAQGDFEAGLIINCAGAWGGRVANLIGEQLPVRHFAPSLMVTARVPHFLSPVVIGIERKLSLKQTPLGTVVIGGGILGEGDLEAQTAETVMNRLTTSARTVCEFFPHLETSKIVRSWAGLEGVTPDTLPVIGPSQTAPNFWHAFGFCGHGYQLGTVVGEVIAETIINGFTEVSLSPFSPERFSESADAHE